MGITRRNRRSRRAAAGFALVMTLVVLVVLTISALSMMLLMKSGISASGNIAFRQAAVRVADLAIEDARTWILAQSTTTLNTDVAGRYYARYNAMDASNTAGFDPKSYDFTNSTLAKKYVDTNGNDTFSGYKIYYVIHRMAFAAGACSGGAACVAPPQAAGNVVTAGSSRSAGSGYQTGITGSVGLVYYRITAKVVGPRFNNRYVQAFVY